MKQLSGGRQRPKYRLSPNEVEQLKREETERRRKLRIVQVREQAKVAAAKIRHNVKQERKRQLVKLACEIETELEKEKEEEVKKLEQQYDNTLRTIGQGHTQAIITDRKTCHAEKHVTAYQNKERAEVRHKEALRKVALDKAYREYEETKYLRDRQAALVEEKKRAAEVAARPPPPPDPISEAVLSKSKLKKPVPLTDMNAFSSTHYHIPDFAVEKAPPEQQLDGKMAGDEEDLRTKEEVSERRKKEHDQIIRARIRGNEALKKEKLKHEYDALMADLSLQQRADRRQRQLVVSKLPKQVFIPPDRRMEELDDKQMEMERAFEDMYMKQMNISGDLSLTLDPNPLPQTPADDSLEATGDSPVVIPTIPPINPALRELTNVSRMQGQATQQGKPDTVLKKLLNKIKEQRSEMEIDEAQVTSGQENLASKSHGKEMSDGGALNFATARIPVSKPASDPQLDLSPLKAPGNQKPHKGVDMEEEVEESTEASETGFLEQLQGRLQAIEMQKEHLDRIMRERLQQQQQQKQQPQFPAFPSDSRPQSSAVPQRPSQSPATASSRPQGLPQAPASWTQSAGPAGDVGVNTASRLDLVKKSGRGEMPTQPHTASSIVYRPTQTYSSSQSIMPTSVDSSRWSVGKGQTRTTPAKPVSQMSAGSVYPDSSATFTRQSGADLFQSSVGFAQSVPPSKVGLVSASALPLHVGVGSGVGISGLRGVGQLQTGVSSLPSQLSTVAPGTFAVASSLSAGMGTRTVGGVQGLPSSSGAMAVGSAQSLPSGGFQMPSSLQQSSVLSWLHSREFASSSTTRPSLQNAGLGTTAESRLAFPLTVPTVSQTQSVKLSGDSGSLTGLLTSAGNEEERLRRLREYQQQLIYKHQERMKTLHDTRTSIEVRQAQSSGQGASLSTSQRLADPVSLVPYTLKTSVLQPETSVSNSSTSSRLPADTAVPLSASASSFPLSSAAGGGQVSVDFSGRGSTDGVSLQAAHRVVASRESGTALSSSGVAAPLESADVFDAMEPILAGSSGVPMTGEPKPSASRPGAQPSSLSDWGDSLPKSTANKLDSVRKSLPFDDLDDTLHRGQAEGEAAGDTDGGADDSHLSSSTERGSPALGSRSNKSSTSGKSGSGLSGMSDGSLGGSSLVARAEEKRLGFEQRQRELQDQLAEIQRQKDALLQRYHGNQLRVSAQEESLRTKLKTAKAASSAPASLSHQPVSAAVSLGVHQSASPSMELEEGSLSSERLSAGHSWAMELEEYSLPHDKSGEQVFKSPASMTLEEVSITSDRSAGATKDVSKVTERSAPEVRPGSSLSSLEEYSIVSSKHLAELGEGLTPPTLSSVRGSQESMSAQKGVLDTTSLDRPNSGRGRLDIRDLMQEVEGVADVENIGGRTGGGTSIWSEILSAEQLQKDLEDAESSRLPPPPTRQAVPITDYEPHELSTILEVDTPQTASKTAITFPTEMGAEGTEKPTSRRYIDFSRHGTATEDDKESKFSASGSSASSDVRSVIEVRPGMLKSASTTGSGEETSFSLKDETRFRENILEASSAKGITLSQAQGASLLDLQHGSSQEVSYASSGQGFQSLELTLDSLTPRSASIEDLQARRYLDYSSKESGGEGGSGVGRGGGGEHVDDVLRQARHFNQDLMSAIQRQSADVFDQSSLSSLSHTAAAGDQSRASQQ